MRGEWAEDRAVEFLKKKGYVILARNYRTRLGEIDIVARREKTLVFVEVKYGKSGRYRVDERKMRRIELAAFHFMKNHPGGYEEVRLDVLEVHEDRLIHLEGISE